LGKEFFFNFLIRGPLEGGHEEVKTFLFLHGFFQLPRKAKRRAPLRFILFPSFPPRVSGFNSVLIGRELPY